MDLGAARPTPLAGTRFIERGRNQVSADAGHLLALLGAEVVQIDGEDEPSAHGRAAPVLDGTGLRTDSGTADSGTADTLTAHLRGAALSLRVLAACRGYHVDVDGPALLGERAALLGFGPPEGTESASGSSYLIEGADGWLAVSLKRPSDVDLLPALMEEPPPLAVADLRRWAHGRRAGEIVERGQLLGIPSAVVGPPDAMGDEQLRARGQGWPPTPWQFDGLVPPDRRPSPEDSRWTPLVVDLTALWAGPLATSLLAMAGCRVVKVEDPERPDSTRSGPAAFFDLLNGGKESVAVPFVAGGALAGLVARADVVVEASRPRALEQLGILRSPHQLWVSITGYGRTGPWRDRVALGDDAAAAGGLVVRNGPDGAPRFFADAAADPVTGLHAAVAALAGIVGRFRGTIDLAMREVVGFAVGTAPEGTSGRPRHEPGRRFGSAAIPARARPGPSAGPRQPNLAQRTVTDRRGLRGREPESSGGDLVLSDVEVEGRPGRTVRIVAGRIVAIESTSPRHSGGGGGAEVLDGRGGAVIAGLRDHHLHLFSMAARRTSVSCGPPDVTTAAGLGEVLRAAASGAGRGEWLRGYGYDESVAGPLTGGVLDALVGPDVDRPIRVQHRSGHAWVLNGRAIDRLRVDLLQHPGVERDPDGRPTGVLYDLDGWLRGQLGPAVAPPLGPEALALAACGITGFSDASAGNGPIELDLVEAEHAAGRIGPRVHLLGRLDLPARHAGMVTTGQRKVLLIERDLPSFEELVTTFKEAGDRGVAIHCVSRETLVLAATALAVSARDSSGRMGAAFGTNRIEHASVAPPELIDLVGSSGATVVTQPGFVAAHGDRYLREVEPIDLPWLYRLRAWRHAGIPLSAGSDAPFGPSDPWTGIRAAVDRRSSAGQVLGPREGLTPEEAVALYQAPLGDPGGGPVRVAVGAPADLCLLSAPWATVRNELDRELVRATVVAGRPVWRNPG